MEQADILPTEMVFTIKSSPSHGHVVKLTNSSDATASPVLDYIHSFTQEDIDEGRILYVSAFVQVLFCRIQIRHSVYCRGAKSIISSVFFQGRDLFTVDVSNGFTTVEDLHISVDIVPRLIPVQAFNFSVKEGLSWPINAEIINISHPFYSSANIEFFVEESPQHGDIRYLDGDELTYFTWEEVGRDIA